MNRSTRRDLLIASAAFVFVPTAAHAYVDPGSAGFVITSALGALAAGGYVVREYWGRLKRRVRHSDGEPAADGDVSDSTDVPANDGSAQG